VALCFLFTFFHLTSGSIGFGSSKLMLLSLLLHDGPLLPDVDSALQPLKVIETPVSLILRNDDDDDDDDNHPMQLQNLICNKTKLAIRSPTAQR
jgi:hypothetical protein